MSSYQLGRYKFSSEQVIEEVILQCNSKEETTKSSATRSFINNYVQGPAGWESACAAAKQLKSELNQRALAVQQAEEVKKIQEGAPIQQVEVIERLSNDKTKMYLMIGGIAILLGVGLYAATK